jgi:hypothetical protein
MKIQKKKKLFLLSYVNIKILQTAKVRTVGLAVWNENTEEKKTVFVILCQKQKIYYGALQCKLNIKNRISKYCKQQKETRQQHNCHEWLPSNGLDWVEWTH